MEQQQLKVTHKRPVEFRKPICPYVCSTPYDFTAERDFLVEKIFPEVNSYCQQRGTYFGPTDIQWKPTDSTVKSGHFLRLSLDYVTKCSPFFICLLGETYGPCRSPDSVLLPATHQGMPDLSDCGWFERNLSVAASAGYQWVLQENQQYGSLTEMEVMQSHLFGDVERSYFYVRQPEHLEMKYPDLTWEERQIAGKTFLPENEYSDLKIRDLKQWIVNNGKSVRYFKTLEELGKMVLQDWLTVIDSMYPPLQNNVNLSLESCRQEIVNQCLMETKIESFMDSPESESIMETLTKFALSTLVGQSLDNEESDQNYWSPSVLNAFRKRSTVHVKKESVITVYGERGSGKTSLIANWLKYFKEESMDITCILSQFFGCATNYTDIGLFMKYCTHELRDYYFVEDREENRDIYHDEQTESFQEIYQSFAAALSLGPCILVIDGIDELRDSYGQSVHQVKELNWLPMPLPSTCKIILSTTSSDLSYRNLCKRSDTRMIKMPLFTAMSSRIDYLKLNLSKYLENFKQNDIKDILSLKMASRPLFLSLLTSQMCLYDVYTNLTKYVDSLMEVSSIRDLWSRCIQSWTKHLSWLPHGDEEEINIDAEYSGWVSDTLKIIALSRNGLSICDVLNILKSLGYKRDRTVSTLDWLKFRLSVGRALYEKPDGLFTFTHQHLKEIVEYILLKSVQPTAAGRRSKTGENFWKQRKQRYHNQLARHFLSLPYSQRCLDEVPWHLQMAGETHMLRQFLSKPQVFMDMIDEKSENPANKQHLFLYWEYLKEEGIDPATTYCQLLNELGFVELDILEDEVLLYIFAFTVVE